MPFVLDCMCASPITLTSVSSSSVEIRIRMKYLNKNAFFTLYNEHYLSCIHLHLSLRYNYVYRPATFHSRTYKFEQWLIWGYLNSKKNTQIAGLSHQVRQHPNRTWILNRAFIALNNALNRAFIVKLHIQLKKSQMVYCTADLDS